MKKHLLIASILGLGMAVAQAQQPMQSGTADPRPGSAPGGMAAPNGMPSATVGQGTNDQAAPQSFKGCLTGSSGNWTLASDKGQTLKLSGTDDQLSSYSNQQVNIQGTQATDGTVKVASIDKAGDSCNNNGQASTSANTDQNANTSSSTSTASTGNSVSSTTPDQNSAANSSQNSAASSTTPSATTSSNNDQNAGVGASGSNSNAGAGQSSQNSMSSSQSTASSDQSNAATTSSTGQSSTATTSADQNANAGQNANASSDQNSVRHISDMDQNQKSASSNADQNAGQQKLPQTASPLPLLGLMGLGSLITGLAARRKK